jgi:hypothetical protein
MDVHAAVGAFVGGIINDSTSGEGAEVAGGANWSNRILSVTAVGTRKWGAVR